MVHPIVAGDLARALPGVTEKDHFGGDAFSAHGRQFAVLWPGKKRMTLRFSPSEQYRFLALDGEGFLPQENAWGKQGWTTAQLEFLDRDTLAEALHAAWENSKVKSPRATSNESAGSKKGTAQKKTAARKKAAAIKAKKK